MNGIWGVILSLLPIPPCRRLLELILPSCIDHEALGMLRMNLEQLVSENLNGPAGARVDSGARSHSPPRSHSPQRQPSPRRTNRMQAEAREEGGWATDLGLMPPSYPSSPLRTLRGSSPAVKMPPLLARYTDAAGGGGGGDALRPWTSSTWAASSPVHNRRSGTAQLPGGLTQAPPRSFNDFFEANASGPGGEGILNQSGGLYQPYSSEHSTYGYIVPDPNADDVHLGRFIGEKHSARRQV